MSVTDRAPKRMKGDVGPMGGPVPPDPYYGQPLPPGGRYASYGVAGGPPMGSGGYMWGQQGHPPPPHSWGHGSPTPTQGSMYQRGGPPMPSDHPGYGPGYPPRGPPPMSGPGAAHRPGKPPGPPPPTRLTGKAPDGPPPVGGAPDGPPPTQGGYPGSYYPPPQGPYGSSPYPPNSPPPMHHPPSSYGNPQPPPGIYSSSPPRNGPSQHPRASPELMGAYCQTTETDNPDLDGMYSSRGVGPPHDDDGAGSTGGGHSSKDKGRGSYKCGRCGVPKKGHVCPYQPKLTRRPGEPLPEMRSAAIQVEMDEFMTLRRLNLRIQGFPESYASEPYGEDMVIGEPHPLPPMTLNSPHGSHDMMNVGDNGPPPSLPSHDHVVGVLGSPIRSSPMNEDPIPGTA